LLVGVGCGGPADEATGSNAGAATVSELGGATATRESADDDSIHLTYPVIVGGGMSDAELSHLNAAVKVFAEGLITGGHAASADCYATLATRELAAVACVMTTKEGLGAHAAFHFIPRTGKSTDLESLFDDNADTITQALADAYQRANEEAWGETAAPDADMAKRVVDSAVVTRTGIMVQEAAIGSTGYDLATWKDLEDALPSKGALADLSQTAAPPLSGNAAWRWSR
jgi:hypothetical protein